MARFETMSLGLWKIIILLIILLSLTSCILEETDICKLILLSSNNEFGTVSGGGLYPNGSRITITAIPKSGYKFTRWSDGDSYQTKHMTAKPGEYRYIGYFERI